MTNCIIISEQAPNQVIVFDKEEKKTRAYSKPFLKRYYEMGIVDLENPVLLYSDIF